MNTLKIKTTTTSEVEIEIPVPCFRRTKDEKQYIGLLDEMTCVKIHDYNSFQTVQNSEVSGLERRELVEAWNNWVGCTESEFLEKYDSVIEKMSLHPKLAV